MTPTTLAAGFVLPVEPDGERRAVASPANSDAPADRLSTTAGRPTSPPASTGSIASAGSGASAAGAAPRDGGVDDDHPLAPCSRAFHAL